MAEGSREATPLVFPTAARATDAVPVAATEATRALVLRRDTGCGVPGAFAGGSVPSGPTFALAVAADAAVGSSAHARIDVPFAGERVTVTPLAKHVASWHALGPKKVGGPV